MRVLIVTHHYLNGYGGGVFASRGFINGFAELYDDVTLMCPVTKDRYPEHINPKVRKIIGVPDRRSLAKKSLDFLSGRFHRFGKAFPELLSGEHFDIIVFDTCYPTVGLIPLARKAGSKVLTIHHNWQYAYEKANARGLMRPVKLMWVKRCERMALLSSDINIVLTGQDRETFMKLYKLDSSVRIEVCPPFEYE